MNKSLYYTAPSDKIFEEVKTKSMKLWAAIDHDNDKYGYTTEKINRIKDLKNIEDNIMAIVSMFDLHNQFILSTRLSKVAKKTIRERMLDGGTPEYLIEF